jgi:hypothetical protein
MQLRLVARPNTILTSPFTYLVATSLNGVSVARSRPERLRQARKHSIEQSVEIHPAVAREREDTLTRTQSLTETPESTAASSSAIKEEEMATIAAVSRLSDRIPDSISSASAFPNVGSLTPSPSMNATRRSL